jgi:parallel beta-helix repeat protein
MAFLWRRKPQRASSRARRRPFLSLQLEALEDRQLPATLTVMNTNDSGAGSFRQALIDANNTTANPGQNTINFSIATSSVQTISLTSPLLLITNPAGVIINATTEGGFAGTPLVVLDGSKAGISVGLAVLGGNSTIKGLAIENFGVGSGIELASSNNTVQGNYVGTDATGTIAGDNFYGIYLPTGAAHNTIGGTTAAARNVVSGNTVFGILLEGSGTSNNLVEGNRIGTDVSGTIALPNGVDGVAFSSASNNTLGGTASGAGNQISGNGRFGVLLSGSGTSGNVLLGNDIGLNAALTAKLGNSFDGVAALGSASGNTLGGTATSAGNVISGNGRFGVLLAANGNVLLGNLIGTDGTGTVALANTFDGVGINGANNTLGGTTTSAGNVISGNGRFGVFLTGPGATGTVITNNLLGTAKGGKAKLGNFYDGVTVAAGASNNTIGGTTAASGNVLSGNNRFGVFLTDTGTTGNLIASNLIGMNAAGTAALGNMFDGVAILSGASDNSIGSNFIGSMNVISGNGRFGVLLGVSGTTDNMLAGNHIGTDAAGTAAFANAADGVAILTGASSNTVGGVVPICRNLISGNTGDGVLVNGCANNLIAGNMIGTDINGSVAVPNTANGIELMAAAKTNTIGGTLTGARNLISGNMLDGVAVEGNGNPSMAATNSTGNVIEGNYIGSDVTGTVAVPNANFGVDLNNSADANTVGGTATGARNVISGNTFSGVNLDGPAQTGNLVQGNYIGTDAAGTHALANAIDGVAVVGSGMGHQTVGGTTAAARNVISGNTEDGVVFDGSTNNILEGNYIGTDFAGTSAMANHTHGVSVFNGASNNTIGGTVAGAQNLISGNTNDGILLFGGTTQASMVSGTVINRNLIGTDRTGTIAVPNHVNGVELNQAANNTIGGTVAGTRNLISGNMANGVFIGGSLASGNVVVGANFIGTDITGTLALHNGGDGVLVDAASGNVIGTAGNGNVLSGNLGNGVHVFGTTAASASGNVITGNFIGTNNTGTAAVANVMDGVLLDGATNTTVGGTVLMSGNVVAGNTQDGILVTGSAATGNLLERNFVGIDVNGSTAIANHGNAGIDIRNSASANTIGGTFTAAANLISGNTVDGIILNGATNNLIEGNFIGTNAAGTTAVANGNDGVDDNNANSNTIGGTLSGARNLISGNTQDGVHVVGSNSSVVLGNFIGTDTAGTTALPNHGTAGVEVNGGSMQNVVGGTVAGAGNLISGNSGAGVGLGGATATGNLVQGNKIGTNAAGSAALANGDGVDINGAASNTIGGTLTGARNTISGNTSANVFITGSTAMHNVVENNYIGTDMTGTFALGGVDGVEIIQSASSNTIGGTVTGTGNLISGNEIGVIINGTATTGNLVAANFIGTDAAGNTALGNTDLGVDIASASGNTIGGTVSGARNIISGNGGNGIDIIDAFTTANLVQGNFIGTDVTGTVNVGNTGVGVDIGGGGGGPTSNTVGGTAAGAGNVIAFNDQSVTAGIGVEIGGAATDTSTVGNAVLNNSIHDNGGTGGLGIDLGADGHTANHTTSPTAGPNDFQNFPLLTLANFKVAAGNVIMSFTFSSVASSTFLIEFYINNAGDTPQGRIFLGSVQVTTDTTGALATVVGGSVNAGVGQITLTPPSGVTPAVGQLVTATATLLSPGGTGAGTVGDTSEFSASTTMVAS